MRNYCFKTVLLTRAFFQLFSIFFHSGYQPVFFCNRISAKRIKSLYASSLSLPHQLCELRDNQLDMADCLHDIENRILAVSHDLSTLGKDQELSQQDQSKKLLMQRMLAELEMSRSVYEVRLHVLVVVEIECDEIL